MRPFDLHHGDTLAWLPTLAPSSIDAVVTDPPYSSGGLYASTRTQASPASKYTQHGSQRFAGVTFDGDNRDQRSWTLWCTLWLSMARRATRVGGYCLMFSDWRQSPPATDALQAAGWTWRGIISWNKGPNARGPHVGYYRHQCEYVIWGTNGPCKPEYAGAGGPWPGAYTFPVLQSDKHHPTGKPTALMVELLRCVRPGSKVLDPFAGSGTTGVAAIQSGCQFFGSESHSDHFATALRRLEEATDAATRAPGTDRQLLDVGGTLPTDRPCRRARTPRPASERATSPPNARET